MTPEPFKLFDDVGMSSGTAFPAKVNSVVLDRIQSITVKPGDALAISVDQNITREQAVAIKAACDIGVPGVKVIILPRGMSLLHIAAPYASGGYVAPPAHPADAIGFDAWMRERTNSAHAAYMARHAAGGIDYSTSLPASINVSTAMRLSEQESLRLFALSEIARNFSVPAVRVGRK